MRSRKQIGGGTRGMNTRVRSNARTQVIDIWPIIMKNSVIDKQGWIHVVDEGRAPSPLFCPSAMVIAQNRTIMRDGIRERLNAYVFSQNGYLQRVYFTLGVLGVQVKVNGRGVGIRRWADFDISPQCLRNF